MKTRLNLTAASRSVLLAGSFFLLAAAVGTGGTAGGGGEGGEGGSGGGFAPGPKDLLSEWGLFDDIRLQIPADDVIPFEVTSQLFTDDSIKHRWVTLRAGGKIEYSQNERWQSPVGTIYVKTFAYPPKDLSVPDPDTREQLIETRLIVHEESGWKVWVYVYNEEMTDADLTLGGLTVSVSWTDELGDMYGIQNYGVPSPVGDGVPRITYVDPVAYNADCADDDWDCMHTAARSYLDSNCSHCHAPDGEVADKLLFVDWGSMDPETGNTTNWGVCKKPTSAGNGVECFQTYDIFPGNPEESLLLCRIESVTAREMMAPLGRSTVHVQGADVIRDWIATMDTEDPRFLPCE